MDTIREFAVKLLVNIADRLLCALIFIVFFLAKFLDRCYRRHDNQDRGGMK